MTATGSSVAIIGAGFTGTLLAVNLLRRASAPLNITLIDKRENFCRGLAYGTGNASHLLNVRAMNMSAFPDEPSHFVDWLSRYNGLALPGDVSTQTGYAFVPRGLYGTYLGEQLEEAVARSGPGAQWRTRVGSVINIERDGPRFALRLDTEERLQADTVALCLGNFPPRLPCDDLPPAHAGQIIPDPWAKDALAAVPNEASLLILGTGLTMVDVVLSLIDQGHVGTITALSRRGLLPHRHTSAPGYRDFLREQTLLPSTILGILRVLRTEVRTASAQGDNWRSVVDAARPYLLRLWEGMPLSERRRFLRHARPYWEIHRHRMAPDVAARINAARKRGQLKIRAGRVKEIRKTGETLLTAFYPRGANTLLHIKANALINCAGPETNFALIQDPLVRALLECGLARPDPLGLGIETTPDGEVIGADGNKVAGLLALGPIARGAFWEMTAVPELRGLCAAVGNRLTGAAA
ncbi:MAG: FAD/NAD(P)-binding protein [Rhodospirillales bacterium]